MRKSMFVLTAVVGLLLGAFQNCGKLGFALGGSDKSAGGGLTRLLANHVDPNSSGDAPSLDVNAHPRAPRRGESVVVTALPHNLDVITYVCASRAQHEVAVASGRLSESDMMFKLNVESDLECAFEGTNQKSGRLVKTSLAISVECGANPKTEAGTCSSFACRTYTELAPDQIGHVPARSAAGECFYAHILTAAAAGAVDPAATPDPDVTARLNADGASGSGAPKLSGRWTGSIGLDGPRAITLAGSISGAGPIKVDDLLVLTFRKASVPLDPSYDVRAFGRERVTIEDNGIDTRAIRFGDAKIPLVRSADDLVLTQSALDVTAFAEVGSAHVLDVRTVSTGDTTGRSDVYLRFE